MDLLKKGILALTLLHLARRGRVKRGRKGRRRNWSQVLGQPPALLATGSTLVCTTLDTLEEIAGLCRSKTLAKEVVVSLSQICVPDEEEEASTANSCGADMRVSQLCQSYGAMYRHARGPCVCQWLPSTAVSGTRKQAPDHGSRSPPLHGTSAGLQCRPVSMACPADASESRHGARVCSHSQPLRVSVLRHWCQPSQAAHCSLPPSHRTCHTGGCVATYIWA